MSWKYVILWDPENTRLCSLIIFNPTTYCIGAFYYMLGNVSPRFRSKISNIQLLALAKYNTVVEFGIDRILQPIVEDIRKLESVSIFLTQSPIKVSFLVNGRVRHFRGTVSIVSADNPASAALGGFKQSASAFRLCRHCMGTEQDIQAQVGSGYVFIGHTVEPLIKDPLKKEQPPNKEHPSGLLCYGC